MILEIKVKPQSSQNKILVFKEPNFLEIVLKAKPEKNQANDSLLKFLANLIGIPKTQIKILKGKTSKNKLIRIDGIEEMQLKKILEKYL
ncbi:MAG: DUF167 domain-containing protein [Candidatus Methanomethyliaceae archaeon]